MSVEDRNEQCKTLAEALQVVISRNGVEVLDGKKPLYAMVSDFLPMDTLSGRQSLNILRNASQAGIPARLYAAISADSNTQGNLLAVSAKLLEEQYGVDEGNAAEFMRSFGEALGWSVEALKSVSPPAPAVSASASGQPAKPKKPAKPRKPAAQKKPPAPAKQGTTVKSPAPAKQGATAKPPATTKKGATTKPPATAKKAEQPPAPLLTAHYPEDANTENIINCGRVAYYDGYYYFSDYKVKSLLRHKVGIWRMDEKTFQKELFIPTKCPVSSISIVDGWLYGLHHVKQHNPFDRYSRDEGEIIKVNLARPSERSSISNKITLGNFLWDSCTELMFYEDGRLFFSRNAIRIDYAIRTDGTGERYYSDVGNGMKSVHQGKFCYVTNDGSGVNTIFLADLNGENETALHTGEARNYFFKLHHHEGYLYYIFKDENQKDYRVAYAPATVGTKFQVFGNVRINSEHKVMNIYKDNIFYLKKDALCKASMGAKEEQVITTLSKNFGKNGIGLLVFEDWIFLDLAKKGLYAISHDGKQIIEIC